MGKNVFYEKSGPYPLNEIVKAISCDNTFVNKNNIVIHGLESLNNATVKDITFLNSQKYKDFSLKTKAAACITTSNLSKFLPEKCIKLNVKNVLFAVTQASKMFYPNADVDSPDETLQDFSKVKNIYPEVKSIYKIKSQDNYYTSRHFYICLFNANIQIGFSSDYNYNPIIGLYY